MDLRRLSRASRADLERLSGESWLYCSRCDASVPILEGDDICPECGGQLVIAEAGTPEILVEKSPPGFSGTVKAMKKHSDIDNPFALAWSMKDKGDESHKATEPGDTQPHGNRPTESVLTEATLPCAHCGEERPVDEQQCPICGFDPADRSERTCTTCNGVGDYELQRDPLTPGHIEDCEGCDGTGVERAPYAAVRDAAERYRKNAGAYV